MKCNEVEELMIDYLDGKLETGQSHEIEKHLETCEKCLDELKDVQEILRRISEDDMEKPDESLRINFYHMLHNEIRKNERPGELEVRKTGLKWYERSVYRIAAGVALLIAGTFLGILFYSGISNSGQARELSELKNEVLSLKKTTMLSMLKESSSSSRIQAVNFATEIDTPDPKIIKTLISTLNNDRNVNVRMAAAYALSRFSYDGEVRDSLVKSLSSQSDPILQVTLINILVEIGDKRALPPIERIISDDKTLPEVRSVAEKGVKMLI